MKSYVAEPFKIKMVEPIKMTTKEERIQKLKEVHYNDFSLRSEDVLIDLQSDSGTGAMSQNQWAGLMLGDEAYSGGKSYYKLLEAGKDIFDYDYIQPVHQGRAGEKILYPSLVKKGQYAISNMFFDTSRAHVGLAGGRAIDCVCEEGLDSATYYDFKGNMNIAKLESLIKEYGTENVAVIVMTITNNSIGGQPVSMENMKATYEIAKKYGIPLIIDAARFAENAYFIKCREAEWEDKSIKEITRKFFKYADAFAMSAKKDAIVNMGGLLGVRKDEALIEQIKAKVIPFEGYLTYGGLAGRDLEALTIGLYEGMDYDYLRYRVGQVEYLGERLREYDIPFQYPAGGHAIFIDAGKLLPHIPYYQFPGHALALALYIEAGVRSGDIGSFCLDPDPETGEQLQAAIEFTRLAIPRRVYTQAHFDVVAEALKNIKEKASSIRGYEIVWQPKVLRHFTAKLKPVD
ncbi:MAG: tryptophanase [Clostridiaceae bacterium]|nr:tryptophanase [Clostridiaceae bacterium]